MNKLGSDFLDFKLKQVELDPELFPGSTSEMWAHQGFLEAHASSAGPILGTIRQAFEHGFKNANGITEKPERVLVTGYSLGAAVGVLGAMSIKLSLPNVEVSSITVGTPKVRCSQQSNLASRLIFP